MRALQDVENGGFPDAIWMRRAETVRTHPVDLVILGPLEVNRQGLSRLLTGLG